MAGGEWVAVLNADVELAPDAVAAWVAKALATPDAAAVASKMMLASHPRFINSIGNSIVRMAWGSDNFMGLLDRGQFDGVSEVWGACFGAVLLSRQALREVGPLDPQYFLYYEDLDWCYRARLAGYRIVTAPGCVIRHQFGGSVTQRHETWKLGLVVRNRMRYVLVNMRWRPALGLLARYLYMDLRQVAKALVTRNPHALRMYAKAYLWLLACTPDIVRRRRHRHRRISPEAESAAFRLNIEPALDSHLGRDPLLSRPGVERWYREVFPPPSLRPGGGAGSAASGPRSGRGRRGEGTATPS
jgi:GT2 family glycosyltransferase